VFNELFITGVIILIAAITFAMLPEMTAKLPEMTTKIKRRSSIFLLASLDFLLAAGSFYLAYYFEWIQPDIGPATQYVGPLAPRAIIFALWIVLGLLAIGMYRARQRPLPWETVVRVFFGTAIGGFCYILFFYLLPEFNTGRGALMGGLTLACIALCTGRLLLLPVLEKSRSI
jgi:hypothetical protein